MIAPRWCLFPKYRERLRGSRLAMDALSAATDLSKEPPFVAAKAGKTYFGPVQFRKGAEPCMPIEQPTRFELVVNLKRACVLGFTIPRSVLLRADQVIE